MKEVFSVVSGRMSEGKTTLVTNLAVLMTQKGYRVAVIDFDPSLTALSSICRIDDVPLTAKNVLEGFADVDDILYRGVSGVLVVPAGMGIKEFRKNGFRDLLEKVAESADILFLDFPGGFGKESVLAIHASTSVLAVMKLDVDSLKASLPVPRIAERLKANFVGVVVNQKMNGEVKVDEVEMLIGNVIGEIPYDDAVKKSATTGAPIIFSSPASKVSRILNEIAEALSVWLGSFKGDRREIVARSKLFKALCP